MPRYSRQKLQDLRDNYSTLFQEFEHGTLRSNPLSPKLRRNNQGGAVDAHPSETSTQTHRDRIQAHCHQTKHVGEFVKIAYPELADPNIETERRDLLSNQESMRSAIIFNWKNVSIKRSPPFYSKISFS